MIHERRSGRWTQKILNHLGYRWMVHRLERNMFKKQGVCISTAAGAGMKSTDKDMEYWKQKSWTEGNRPWMG